MLPAIGQERVAGVLKGGRAEEDDAREVPAVGAAAAGPRDELEQVPAVRVRLVHAGEGLVVAEEGEHDVRPHLAQVLGHMQLALAPRVGVGPVAARAQVAEAHLLTAEARLQQGLQPAVVLHPLRQRVAEERDDLARPEREGQGIAVPGGHGEQLRLARRGRRRLGGRLRRGLRGGLGRRLRVRLRLRLGGLRRRLFRGLLLRRGLWRGTGIIVRRDRAGEARVLRRLHAARVAEVAVGVGPERPHETDREVGTDRVLQARRPEAAVHQQAPVTLVEQVLGRPVERGEHAPGPARRPAVGARPLGGLRRLGRIGGRVRRHPVQRLREGQDLAVHRLADVGAHVGPDVLHAAEDRVARALRDDGDARALGVVAAEVADPGLPEHLVPEAQLVAGHLAVVGELGERVVRRGAEGVRGRAQADDRAAAREVGLEVAQLLHRRRLEAQEHDREVRRRQRLHPGQVRRRRIDLARGRVDREQDGALEAVVQREDARERRQGLLGTVLVVAGQEDDVLAPAEARRALVHEGLGAQQRRENKQQGQQEESGHTGKKGWG